MQVRIFQPTSSTMQSGDGNGSWVLEFVTSPRRKFIENVMGRTGSLDTLSEIKMRFDTYQEAVNFAESRNYTYELIKPKKPRLIKKSYASNFG